MIYQKDLKDFHIDTPTAITLGKFDGLHRGHMLLIDRLLAECADYGYEPVAFTFDVAPSLRIDGTGNVSQLLTKAEKQEAFRRKGIECVLECPFTDDVRTMSPIRFVMWMVGRYSAKLFVVGDDFHFGCRRMGDAQFLQAHEEQFGYRTIVLPKLKEEPGGREISSTYVRELIAQGEVAHANQLLGYTYFVSGEVGHGWHRGHDLGFPTANLQPQGKQLPEFGVYAVQLWLDGQAYAGVANVGVKPTFGGQEPPGVETFLLDYSGDLYGRTVKVDFLKWLRPEMVFDSGAALSEQIRKDAEIAKKMLQKY